MYRTAVTVMKIVVIGAGQGLGLVLVKECVRRGHPVAAGLRRPDAPREITDHPEKIATLRDLLVCQLSVGCFHARPATGIIWAGGFYWLLRFCNLRSGMEARPYILYKSKLQRPSINWRKEFGLAIVQMGH